MRGRLVCLILGHDRIGTIRQARGQPATVHCLRCGAFLETLASLNARNARKVLDDL